jgi:hypothetical protein
MSFAASRVIATRALSRRAPVQQQKRGIVDYLTNYPDKVCLPWSFGGTVRPKGTRSSCSMRTNGLTFFDSLYFYSVGQ